MRILHLCLADFYIDNYNYQENNLPRINKEDGHDVYIIASTETYVDNINLGYVEPSEYITEYGVPISRIPYKTVGNAFMTRKIRKYEGLYEKICQFSPDVIMSHGLTYWSVLEVIKYLNGHQNVVFFADTHADYYTSATNALSKYILHRGIYRFLAKKAIPYVKKYFYISESCKKFALNEYQIPLNMMEFYPLGGYVPTDKEYSDNRRRIREELNISDSELLFVHAGKLEANKKTIMLLEAFSAVRNLDAKLIIIGAIADDIKDIVMDLINNDSRVCYLGWKNPVEMEGYLSACDLYCQPGKVSAIMQNAICERCPLILYPYEDYVKGYNNDNVIWVKDKSELERAFANIKDGAVDLKTMSDNSKVFADRFLNYYNLAARLYNNN